MRLVVFALLALAFTTPAIAVDAEVRALWVDSFNPGLRSPQEIDDLIARAKQGNLNTIIAQVRRNAQSLYAEQPDYSSAREGWVENYIPPAGFDPLQDLIEKAHANGIEVHAWANIGPIYSGHPGVRTAAWPCRVPCDPNHLFNLHGYGKPEADYWLTRTHPSFRQNTHPQFPGERMADSGLWFLDLGHPGAADHTINVLTDIVRNYDVDGIHLDYIRYAEMPIVPRPPAVGLSFSIGYNPVSVRRFNEAYNRNFGTLPNPWDASWSQWRRDQVTAFVRRLYLEINYLEPQVKLSAALITFFRGPNSTEPRTFQQTEAYYRVFQDWGGWMKEGILDLSIPMIYKSQHLSSHVVQFREWINFTKNSQYDRHGLLGLGSYMNTLENTIVQIEEGRAPSSTGALSQGFNFFSYNATNTAAAGKPLRARDEFFRALTQDGAYAAEAPFELPAEIPAMSWKTEPRAGHLLAQIIGQDGLVADGAKVTIRKMGKGPNDEEIVQYADGNGFVGGIDLNPGAYQLVIEYPDGTERHTIPEPVVPGRVTRVRVDLRSPARGPMARAERSFGEHDRTDQFEEAASELEEWRGREPVPEDLTENPE